MRRLSVASAAVVRALTDRAAAISWLRAAASAAANELPLRETTSAWVPGELDALADAAVGRGADLAQQLVQAGALVAQRAVSAPASRRRRGQGRGWATAAVAAREVRLAAVRTWARAGVDVESHERVCGVGRGRA